MLYIFFKKLGPYALIAPMAISAWMFFCYIIVFAASKSTTGCNMGFYGVMLIIYSAGVLGAMIFLFVHELKLKNWLRYQAMTGARR